MEGTAAREKDNVGIVDDLVWVLVEDDRDHSDVTAMFLTLQNDLHHLKHCCDITMITIIFYQHPH